ncbi:hypothetical protein FACS1894208_04900 [Clostridia bacterium]|nr:hypothetical protein FACS1894208_04900 [Clostridia bacterium]
MNETYESDLQLFDSVEITERQYCWTPYIPMRCVTLLQGDPQTAKSTVIRAIAAALSNGSPLPPNGEQHEPMRVLLQNAEDDFASGIVPHLRTLGANMRNFARINEDNASVFFYDERIEENIARFRPQLVVFDTLQRYAGGRINLNDYSVVTALFDYLADIARRYDCAMVVVSHLNKQDTKAEYKGFGSVGIRASVRSTLTAGRIGDNGRFGLFHSKSNGTQAGAALEFEVFGDADVRWLGTSKLTERQLLSGKGNEKRQGKSAIARKWLEDNLADGNAIWVVDIAEAMEELGTSLATAKRVKKELGIKAFKKDRKTWWAYELPDDAEDDFDDE